MTLLHVVRLRTGQPPEPAVAATDWIVYRHSDRWRLDAHGDPPLPPGSIDHAQLARLVLAADRTVTW